MPSTTALVTKTLLACGDDRLKTYVSQSLSAGAIAPMDFLARDANGRIGQLFSSGGATSSSNITSTSTTVITAVAAGAYPTTTAAGTLISAFPAEDDIEFVLPIVNTSNVPLVWSQAYAGMSFGLRRVQNDDALTNLRNLYVAVYSASPVEADSPLKCVRRDPETYTDDYAYGIFRLRPEFCEV